MVMTAPRGRTGSGPGRPSSVRAQAARAARFRRALVLMGATVVAPGTAQFIAGNRAVGRVALQVWAGLVVAVGLVVWLVPLDTLAGLAVRPWLLTGFKVVAFAIALAWIVLIIDAWRLGDPPALFRKHRVVMLGVTLALAGLVATPFLMAARYASAAHDAVVALFPSGEVAAASDGRLNILLLGSDAGAGRVGTRPDSINLVSVDVRTGAPVVIGIPRNLERARFPSGTPAAAEFPRGFTGSGDRVEWMINSTWTYGEENPHLFPGEDDPGAAAVKQAVEGTLGLPVHYYVLVDMQGFRDLIDAVGGITIRVEEDLPIGQQGNVLEAGLHTLDGGEALWYARSRTGTSDYDRMARQRCVLGAMAKELDPGKVLQNFTALADASEGVGVTNIPQQQLPDLVDLAWKAKDLPITSLQLAPPVIVPADPNLEVIAAEVDTALAESRDAVAEATAEAAADEEVTADAAPGDDAADEEAGDEAEGDSGEDDDAPPPPSAAIEDVCSFE